MGWFLSGFHPFSFVEDWLICGYSLGSSAGIDMKRICSKCKDEIDISNFRIRKNKKGNNYTVCVCLFCERKQKAKAELKRYNEMTHEQKVEHGKLANQYSRTENGKSTRRSWQKLKEQTDITFKLKRRIGALIRSKIKKCTNSSNTVLGYSIQELRTHLESLFEPWMSWDNWGRYNPQTWDDLDSKTWTWQIDHIIPISSFKIKTIGDEEFKNGWALNNLRPFSAKANILKGKSI